MSAASMSTAPVSQSSLSKGSGLPTPELVGTTAPTAGLEGAALLLLSFGGPEKPEDVVPFLENVTRGRGIPRERLEQVGEHYFTLGGRSPINDQNKQIIDNLRSELRDRQIDMPVYFGNRNWEPYVEDALVQVVKDGYSTVFIFATSAWGGYSGCFQYQEDISRGLQAVVNAGLEPPLVIRLPQFHNNPVFVSEFAAAVNRAVDKLPESLHSDADLIFTAHSIPSTADDAAGPAAFGGNLYSKQVLDAARLVQQASIFADRPGSTAAQGYDPVARNTGDDGPNHKSLDSKAGAENPKIPPVELVWQSRSGSPHTPWLEPDVCDHINQRAAQGNNRPIVLCPLGFMTDHVEVVWDLDTEAKQAAEDAGIPFVRVDTPGLSPQFAKMIIDMVAKLANQPESEMTDEQQAAAALVEKYGAVPNYGCTTGGQPCAPGCCGSAIG